MSTDNATRPARILNRRTLIRIVTWVVAGGVAAVIVLFCVLRVEHGFQTYLPTPTGPLPVARTSFYWANPDAKTDAAFSPYQQPSRELAVWIWYPVAAPPSVKPAEYVPGRWRDGIEQYEGFLLGDFLNRDLARVHAHTVDGGPVSPVRPAYPVVIIRPGLSALTTDFTTLAEDLASHGYFVVGFDAPYRTQVVVLPDGRVIRRAPVNNPEDMPRDEAEATGKRLAILWATDTRFIVDQLEKLNAGQPANPFAGRLDLKALGIVGHSLGGATAVQFCHDDPRCKAGIDIDGALRGDSAVVGDGLRQPFMFILSDHRRETDADARDILARMQSVFDRLPPDKRVAIVIRGANHFSFGDQILLKSHTLMRLLRFTGILGPLDPRRGLAITTDYVHRFFDVYLKGAPAAQVAAPSPYPEVRFGLP